MQCGLLIDNYWLWDGMDYCPIRVLNMFSLILDWISDLLSVAHALSVANEIVREVPALDELVVYMKRALIQEIRSWDEE